MPNTTVQANIYKNGDSTKPLTGYILLQARSNITDGANLFITDPVKYPLVNGSVSMSLAATDLIKVSYNFQIWEVDVDVPDRLVYQFDALVPYSATPINLNQLAQQSGVRYDQQDASLLTLANYILSSNILNNRLLDKLLNVRGLFNSTSVYKKGDAVIYDGDGYIYVSDIASSGNFPNNLAYWKKYVSKGDTGSASVGDNSAYSAAWNNSTTTPSRNAIYQKIETLLSLTAADARYGLKTNGTFTAALQDPTNPVPANDNSARLVDASWVRSLTNPYSNQMAIGGRYKWDNTLALPAKTLRANGIAVSRTIFASLFQAYGTTYGAGDGSTTFNLPNDPGFIIFTGVLN